MDLRKKITQIVIDNVMIDIDNTGQEQYKMNEVQLGLLIDNLIKQLNIDDVSVILECEDCDGEIGFDDAFCRHCGDIIAN